MRNLSRLTNYAQRIAARNDYLIACNLASEKSGKIHPALDVDGMSARAIDKLTGALLSQAGLTVDDIQSYRREHCPDAI